MLHLSRFQPEPTQMSTFLACLWQGDVPSSLELQRYLYTSTDPLAMALVWEGDDDAVAFMERAFAAFGEWEDQVVTDQTPAMRAALARDLDEFGNWMRRRGAGDDAIAQGLDLRRRGKEAPSQAAARDAAAAFDAEHHAT